MKILFDHQAFSLQRFGGISKYFANLHKEINNTECISSDVSVLYTDNEYLKDDHIFLNNRLGRRYFSGNKDKLYKWNRRFSRWNVRYGNYDVFHPTYFDLYFVKYISKPFVVTIHDMIYELMPDIFDNAREIIKKKQLLIKKADAIISISEHTKQDILKFYPEVERKITVIHHGVFPTAIINETTINLPKKYILYVGERWLYKNFNRFIFSISPLLQTDRDLKLVCVGGGIFLSKENELLQQNQIASQCLQINVNENELQQLYSNAIVFVFPSLAEGFGLPILEAFSNNCPVACSYTPSFREVADDAAVYFDPFSQESIREAVAGILYDPLASKTLKTKGMDRLEKFRFDTCLKKTLKVYQLLASR